VAALVAVVEADLAALEHSGRSAWSEIQLPVISSTFE